MSLKEAYPQLVRTLDGVRGQWRTHKILEGLLLTAAGGLAVLLALVAADNLFQPGQAARFGMACALWGGLAAAVLSLVVKRCLEDHRDDYFAALVEGKHPELNNQLINAVQLGRDNSKGFSRGLIEAVVRDAHRAVGELEPADSVDRRPALRAAGLALLALLLTAGYAAALTPRFTNGLSRVLLPLADIAPYTRTQILAEDVEPGDTKIVEGGSVTVGVLVRGVVPDKVELYRHLGGGRWQSDALAADPSRPGHFVKTLPQVGASFDYYVAGGDGRSPRFRVTTVPPPQVSGVRRTYTFPAYTGWQPRQIDGPDGEIKGGTGFKTVAGTTVHLEVTATKPLLSAELKTRARGRPDAGTVELGEGQGDRRSGTFTLWAEGARNAQAGRRLLAGLDGYQIKLKDAEGFDSNDTLWRGVSVDADLPPAVKLHLLSETRQVKPGDTLKLVIDSQDDVGLAAASIRYRVNSEGDSQELVRFAHDGEPARDARDAYEWRLAGGKFKVGDRLECWAEATDRNDITGPGKGTSDRVVLEVVDPLKPAEGLRTRATDHVKELVEIIKLQKLNRAETDGGVAFKALAGREVDVRGRTGGLAKALEADGVPAHTVVDALQKLAAGAMARLVRDFETGAGAEAETRGSAARATLAKDQDEVIRELEAILVRLQRNEEAKQALKRMEKKDAAGHKAALTVLTDLLKNLNANLRDTGEMASKFERLPKKGDDKYKEDVLKALNDLDELKKRTEKWTKGTVNELTKMPKGFADDFDLRKDVNKIYEEVEKASEKAKAEKIEVSLEDLGAGLATRMKEDLEMWMPDSADSAKWVMEEPADKKPMKIPEMPLPKALQDLVGELLQRADEFDEDADDVTSAWGDNLDQAGWGVSDGPISSFSAKGKTGNDQPNNMELTGRSGSGRRGKSTGQAVGDTSKGLPGRKTPARVTNENYEPGKLKQEGAEDPNGSTGGGKKTGAGKIGLQGGAPPDVAKDVGRLSEKQAGMREKMEQVAKKLESQGVSTTRVREGIRLLEEADKALADRRYDDAAKRRHEAVQKVRDFGDLDRSTAAQISKARDLSPELRKELLQSSEAAYPAGYESLLKSYYKALSTSEK